MGEGKWGFNEELSSPVEVKDRSSPAFLPPRVGMMD